MWKQYQCLQRNRIYSCIVGAILLVATTAYGDPNLLKRAQEEFSQKNYQQALVHYRAYLRENPNDADAWTGFAASTYHTGDSRRALLYLQRMRPSEVWRAYNLFYQALCFDALEESKKARAILARLARTDHPLAEDAYLEKAAIEIEESDIDAAKSSVESYLERFKEGRYRDIFQALRTRLVTTTGPFEVPESQRARLRRGLYEQNPRSLFKYPHVWYYQLGGSFLSGERSKPGSDEEGKPIVRTGNPFQSYAALATAGITLGPIRGSGIESYAGYSYSQDWLSTPERVQTYLHAPSDLLYIPFRPDLMERTHRFHVSSNGENALFNFGAYAHWEFKRAGSQLYPAPERPEIRKALDVAQNQLIIPWVDIHFTPKHTLRGLLYFEKQLNQEQPDFSFKTYNLGIGSEEPFVSAAIQEISTFGNGSFKIESEVFRRQYIDNDLWEGYTSLGIASHMTLKMGSRFRLKARVAVMKNQYLYEVIKSGTCSAAPSKTEQAISCPRIDNRIKVGGTLSYVYDKHLALSFVTEFREIKNPSLPVYNETAMEFLVYLTQSFPTLDQAARFIEPPRSLASTRGVY